MVVDKQYQKADWRLRPLSPEQLLYARNDSKLLLQLLPRLLDALRKQAAGDAQAAEESVRAAFRESQNVALRSYRKPGVFSGGFETLACDIPADAATQRDLFALLWRMRDALARALDESPGVLISNKFLLDLSRSADELQPLLDSLVVKGKADQRFAAEVLSRRREIQHVGMDIRLVAEPSAPQKLSLSLVRSQDALRLSSINEFRLQDVMLVQRDDVLFRIEQSSSGERRPADAKRQAVVRSLQRRLAGLCAPFQMALAQKEHTKAERAEEKRFEQEADFDFEMRFESQPVVHQPLAKNDIISNINNLKISDEFKRKFLSTVGGKLEKDKLEEISQVMDESRQAPAAETKYSKMITGGKDEASGTGKKLKKK